ncbi:MAG: aldehyde dehydrogenase [Phycisphaerae bacterium]|nr:aldehyde dehydrogenase [Phycisphaerae bacterium]
MRSGSTADIPGQPTATEGGNLLAAWSDLPGRLAWVRAFRRLVATHQDELVALVAQETHKPPFEALTADILPLLVSCRWHERRAAGLLRPRRVRGKGWFAPGQRHWVHREPVGLVGIIATWNYPLQLLGIQLVQALVAGNRVVVKPSEHAPNSQQRLMELAVAAGLPHGVLRWTEATRDAGPRMLDHERPDHVIFTGSTRVGRQVAAWAAQSLTPTTLELSGHDSALVLADADPALAARAIWNGVVMNAGQTCMAPRRVLVDRSIYDRFLDALAPLAAGARPLRLIDDAPAARCWELASSALADGARSLSGVLERPDGPWIRPLAMVDCPPKAALVDGDHFGPVVAVVPVSGLEDALRVHRRGGQHLSASVYTRDVAAARHAAAALGASYVTINDTVLPTVHPATGIGGRGLSGWGVSRGDEGLLAMTRAVTISATSARLRLPMGTPTTASAAALARLIRRVFGGGRPPGPVSGASARANEETQTVVLTRAAPGGAVNKP